MALSILQKSKLKLASQIWMSYALINILAQGNRSLFTVVKALSF